MGGLGNQMFQYAAGRSLAWRLGTDLRLDRSFLEAEHKGNTPRPYELHCFNISAEAASAQEIAMLLGEHTFANRLRAAVRRRLGMRWELSHLYREPHYHYDEAFTSLPDNTYLKGYWHSERYFSAVAARMAAEFTIRYPLAGRNQGIAADIAATESVSIHIRRGDYVTDRKIQQTHGSCSLEYYRDAVAMMGRSGSPHFFLFSDDHDWVRKNLQIGYPTTVVDCNGTDKGYEDLRLMSLCRHNIIANSSFSWWGAWLNRNPDKTVIAPSRWFNNQKMDEKDLLPAGWLRL